MVSVIMNRNVYDNYRICQTISIVSPKQYSLPYKQGMHSIEKKRCLKHIQDMADMAVTSISGLGIKAGLSPTTLNKLFEPENTSMPRTDTLNKLARAVGFDSYDAYISAKSINTQQHTDAEKKSYTIFRQILKNHSDLTIEQELTFKRHLDEVVRKEIAKKGSSSLDVEYAESLLNALLSNSANINGTP